MKFLGIQALKTQLSEGSLKQSEVFGYWLASSLLLHFLIFPMAHEPTDWDFVFWAASLVVIVVMLRKCYLDNGGESGVKFSDKFISITWVMTLRGFLFVFVPLVVVGSLVIGFLGLSDEATNQLIDNSALIDAFVFELWVWFRTAAHIKDICVASHLSDR